MEKIVNEQINNQKIIRETQIVTCIVNLIYILFGISMVVIGIIYQSLYEYQYSFNIFNPTLVASILIALGVLIVLLAVENIVFFFLKRKLLLFLAAISTILIVVLFVALLIIGIWGLTVATDPASFSNDVRTSMLRATQNNGNDNSYMTMDWIQSNFQCCGIHSYKDWGNYLHRYGPPHYDNRYGPNRPDENCYVVI